MGSTCVKAYLDRSKVEAKAKFFFDACPLFFDLLRFRSRFQLVGIGPYC